MKPKTLADLIANPPEGWFAEEVDTSGLVYFTGVDFIALVEVSGSGVILRAEVPKGGQTLDELAKAHEAVAALLRALKEVL